MIKRNSKKWSIEDIPESMISEFSFNAVQDNERPKNFYYSSSKTLKELSNIPGQFTFSAHEHYQPTAVSLETFSSQPIKSKFTFRDTDCKQAKRQKKPKINQEIVPKEYPDWKIIIYNYLSNEHSFVTEGYLLDLKTVNPGIYTVGTDSSCDKRVTKGHAGSPTCPDLLGYLFVYGDNECTLTLNQEDIVVDLVPGMLYSVTPELKIRVTESKIMAIVDIKRMAYVNLLKKNSDMFFPYNPALVFHGEMLSEAVLMIKVKERNQELKLNYFCEGGFYELFYIDLLAENQKYMECRVVKVQSKGNEMVVDFNFSYCVSTGKNTLIPINHINWSVDGGINPKYF
ncbi:hypothetical protein HDV04_001332 [Boothiomyces sp. JEL0838]|nr:hypothetical protein HDV04_001332 [Boothiomyces sp. JEL0838]